ASPLLCRSACFSFNAAAHSELYALSLHDALPIFCTWRPAFWSSCNRCRLACSSRLVASSFSRKRWFSTRRRERSSARRTECSSTDRKSTRLNSSHVKISYAVFCLKKKKKQLTHDR